MEGTGCDLSLEELQAILKGTGNEKPQSLSNEIATSGMTEDYYMAPKAEDVLKEETTVKNEVEKGDEPASEVASEYFSNFSSKQWKDRLNAYNKVLELLNGEEKLDIINEMVAHLAQIVDDSNVSAMDSALELAAVWAKHATNSQVKSSASDITKAIVSRAFACRNTSQSKAHEVVLNLMEVDGAIPSVVQALLDGTSNKKPKIPPECIKCLQFAYVKFGAKPLPNKEIIAALKTLFEAKSKEVRAASMDLVVEMARWIGRIPLEAALMSVRDAVKKDISAQLDSLTSDKPTPTLGTRSAREAALKASGLPGVTLESMKGDGDEVKGIVVALGSQEVDVFDIVEAVNLPAELAKTDYDRLVAKSSKWNEKKQGIELAINLIGPTPKIDHECAGLVEFVRSLTYLIDHSHFQVSSSAIRLFSLIGQGLREHFHSTCHAPEQFAILTAKFKDKKLAPVISEALDKLVLSGALRLDHLDKVHEFNFDALVCAKKQPVCSARVAALDWLSRTVITMTEKENKLADAAGVTHEVASAHVHHLRTVLLKLAASSLSAAEKENRESAEQLLLAVCRTADKNPKAKEHVSILKFLNKEVASTKPKLVKLAEEALLGSLESTSKTSESGKVSNSDKESCSDKKEDEEAGGASTDKSNKKSGVGSKKKMSGDSKSAETSSSSSSEQSVHPPTLSDTDSIDAIGEILYANSGDSWSEVKHGLLSSKWSEKTEAYNAIATRCGDESLASSVGNCSEAIVVMANFTTKSWTEKNAVIIVNAFEMITACANACTTSSSSFHRGAATLAASAAVTQLSNRKLSLPSSQLLTALTKAVGANIIGAKVCSEALKLKNVAAQAAIAWVVEAVEEFGAKKFSLAATCTLALTFVTHRDSKVRSSSLELLASLYKVIGPKMRQLALPASLSKSVAKTIEETLDNAGYDPKNQQSVSSSVNTKDSTNSNDDVLDGLQRLDISTLLDVDEVIRKMSDVGDKDSWKQRKAALEQVQEAVSKSGQFLTYNAHMTEMVRSVKMRVADNHNILKPVAIALLGELLRSIESSHVPKALKSVAPELLAACQDTKNSVRELVVKTIDYCICIDSVIIPGALDSLFSHVCTALKNTVGRIELLGWLTSHCGGIKVNDAATRLLPPLFSALQDKNKLAREAAAQCLNAAAESGLLSKSKIEHAWKDQGTTAKRNLEPFVSEALKKCQAAAHTAAESTSSSSAAAVATSVSSASTVQAESNAQVTSSRGTVSASYEESKSGLLRHNGKKVRNEDFKGKGKGWPSENPDIDELQSSWSKYLNTAATDALFPKKARAGFMESGASGLDLLDVLMIEAEDSDDGWDLLLEHLDFIFKWITVRLSEKESVPVLSKLLDFMNKLSSYLYANQYTLLESEAQILFPYLCEKSGHKRFFAQFQSIMGSLSYCYSSSKYVGHLLMACEKTKQASTKARCLEEVARVISHVGEITLFLKKRKSGQVSMLIEAVQHVEAHDKIVREAGLQVVASALAVLMYDGNKLVSLLREGNTIKQSVLDLALERMKTNKKEAKERDSPRLNKRMPQIAPPPVAIKQRAPSTKNTVSSSSSSSSSSSVSEQDAAPFQSDEERSRQGVVGNGDDLFGHLCLETPQHDMKTSSRVSASKVAPQALNMADGEDEEDDDVFTFQVPQTPSSRPIATAAESFGDILPNLLELDDDMDFGLDLCASPSPREQVLSKFDILLNTINEFLAFSREEKDFPSSNVEYQSKKRAAYKAITKIHDSTLPQNFDKTTMEELKGKSSELISAMAHCLQIAFPANLGDDDSNGNVDLTFSCYSLAGINAIVKLPSCSIDLSSFALTELFSSCVPRLLATKHLIVDEQDSALKAQTTSALNGVILGALSGCGISNVVSSLVQLLCMKEEHNSDNVELMNLYVKLFLVSSTKNSQSFRSVDMMQLAPHLAALCNGSDSFSHDSVRSCVLKLLEELAQSGHGNGMFTLSLCMNMSKVSETSVVFDEIKSVRKSVSSVPYCSSDGNIEEQLQQFTKSERDSEARKVAVNEFSKIKESLTGDKLDDWFKYRAIPSILVESINYSINNSMKKLIVENKPEIVTKAVEGKDVGIADRLQAIKQKNAMRLNRTSETENLCQSASTISSVSSTMALQPLGESINPQTANIMVKESGEKNQAIKKLSDMEERLRAIREKSKARSSMSTSTTAAIDPVVDEDTSQTVNSTTSIVPVESGGLSAAERMAVRIASLRKEKA